MDNKKTGTGEQDLSRKRDLENAKNYFRPGSRLLKAPINRAAYSDRMAWILACMSHLAYDRYEDKGEALELFTAKLEGGGFKVIKVFFSEKTDTQAFLAANKDFAVLAFRGTEVTKKEDVKTDAKALKVSTLQGRVHAGFTRAYESVETEIMESVKGLGEMPLYITGHSLGAALATVATQRLEHDPDIRDKIAACYTYGSPRLGDNQFDMEFKSIIYRIVNTTDIVTVIPLLAMGYIHVGDVRFLGRKPTTYRRNVPIFGRIFLFVSAIFKLFGPLVGDHAIVEYIKKLEAIAEKRNTQNYGRR
jgi:hypothetical protein